jgi:hypothetical protein
VCQVLESWDAVFKLMPAADGSQDELVRVPARGGPGAGARR